VAKLTAEGHRLNRIAEHHAQTFAQCCDRYILPFTTEPPEPPPPPPTTANSRRVVLSNAERAAIKASLDAAGRGEFATDAEVRAVWAKHGL
jgi:hypothetical protein